MEKVSEFSYGICVIEFRPTFIDFMLSYICIKGFSSYFCKSFRLGKVTPFRLHVCSLWQWNSLFDTPETSVIMTFHLLLLFWTFPFFYPKTQFLVLLSRQYGGRQPDVTAPTLPVTASTSRCCSMQVFRSSTIAICLWLSKDSCLSYSWCEFTA